MLLQDLSQRDWLGILNQSLLTPALLPVLLVNNGVSVERLTQLARMSLNLYEPYGRHILYKSPEIEVMLAKWSYRSAASPHNHGYSRGLIWFLKGDFNEQHFQFSKGQLNAVGAPVYFAEGDVATVVSSDIHSCSPVGEGISLHLYSPAIQEMKVWDLANKETLTVADECGAWVPQKSDLIIKRVKWE